MKFLRRTLTGVFLLAITLGIIAVAGNTIYGAIQAKLAEESPDRPARERVFAVNVVPIRPETVSPVLTTYGEVRSRRSLEVRAQSSGTVIALGDNVEEGGAVKASQLLVQIDPTDAETALAVARTDLDDAQAEVRDAERNLELAADDLASAQAQATLRERALQRQRDLTERGVGSAAAVETAELTAATAQQAVLSRRQALAQAEARVDSAKTSLARARIAMNEAQRAVEDTMVHAAFSGVLNEVNVVEGGLVSQNEVLARLIDPDALEISFRVSTAQYARLIDAEGNLIGLPLSVALEVGGVSIESPGRISRESAAVGEGQTGRLLFARLDTSKGFRAGDFATVRVEEPPLQNVTRLPAAAVDAAATVLVVNSDDRLEMASVEVMRRQGDDVLVRAPGLAGQLIVAERSPLLGAGIKVRPIRPQGAAQAPEPEVAAMVELTEERRARLVAFVEGNSRMPAEAKARVLSQLKQPQVPAQTIERLESRMGG